MSTYSRGYSYNPINNTLSLSATFIKKASRLGTEEYNILLQYQKDHPKLTIAEMEKKPSEHKRESITYVRMEGVINHCRDKEVRMAQYKRMRTLAEMQDAPFHKLKVWFLANYANYDSMDDVDDEGFFLPKTKEQVMAEKKAAEDAKAAQSASNITELSVVV